jgi:hypothetical protein
MATHITSGTVVANTVSTVTFSAWFENIEIVNRSTNDMWARVDGVDPTIAGDECFYIAPQGFITVINPQHTPEPAAGITSNTVVKMIAGTNSNFTVQAGL